MKVKCLNTILFKRGGEMQTLIFTAEGDYARFRCPHTTTSALTFSTIHPIAVRGLIGAILGVEYEQLYGYTKNMKIGIQVVNPIYKDTQSFNLIAQTNNNKSANFQSRIQFLRDVKYRIFVNSEIEKLELLKDTIKNRNYVFTPYLGCSEHIAKLEYEGIFKAVLSEENLVDTIVPKQDVDISQVEDRTIFMDRIPTRNNKNREYLTYTNVVIAIEGGLSIKSSEIFKVGDYNVFFL